MGVEIARAFAGGTSGDGGDGRGGEDRPAPQLRKLILTPASDIKPRRVRWLWDKRIAYGTLALLAGREGLGKSTLAYQLAGDITRGTLAGEDLGNPRSVLVCASEDSWEHTIVPRLIAAGTDLDRVFRVEIETYNDMHLSLSLPRDFTAVREAATLVNAGLMILDPLMSVIDGRLDTHRDREVRTAIEPLATLANDARMAILGLIHHNKSGSTDALQLVMGSKAFSAVARSVHTCIPDPDDETQNRRLFATSKNNLGRLDLPVLGFTITSHAVETEDDGTAWTGRLHWTGEVDGSMHEIMTRSADPERSATAEAADWLQDYLAQHGGELPKVDVEKAGRVAGHAPRTLQRASARLRLEFRSFGFPRRTYWALPGTQPPDDPPVDITEPRHQPDEPNHNAPDQAAATDPASRANTPETPQSRQPLGATGANKNTVAPPQLQALAPLDSRASRANLGATVAQLDLTSGNAEIEPPEPHARTHARGDTQVGTTGDLLTETGPEPSSRASRANDPPRTPARENHDPTDIPIPTCDDCGWPIDNPHHERTCDPMETAR